MPATTIQLAGIRRTAPLTPAQKRRAWTRLQHKGEEIARGLYERPCPPCREIQIEAQLLDIERRQQALLPFDPIPALPIAA